MADSGSVRVSVPGKLILMGEHSAVYGYPAVVAAAGMRLRAAVSHADGPQVEVEIPGLGIARRTDWQAVLDTTASARVAWRAYADDPTPARFAALRSEGAGDFVLLALGEALQAAPCDGSPPDIRLRVESEIPVGAGFGSSAAAAVGIAAALTGALHGEVDWSAVAEAAWQVEQRQHGSPSGIDAAAVCQGGVLRARRSASGLDTEPLAARPELLGALRIYSSGAPAESTGQVVAGVRAVRDRDPSSFEQLQERMGAGTRRLIAALTSETASAADLIEPVRDYHRCLCDLGVVPAEVRKTIRAIEAAGGAAKISGAGSLQGPGAGSLLSVHPDPEFSDPALEELLAYPVALGVEGARVESLAVVT